MSDTQMTTPRVDPAAPKGYRGRVEQIVQGILHGWVYDAGDPDQSVAVEVLVDDEVVDTVIANRFRGDLYRSAIGNGQHAFMAAIPRRFFNGAPHDVTARIAGSRQELRHPLIGQILHPAAVPDFQAAISAISGGRIEGYAFDAAHPDKPIQLDLMANGRMIECVLANKPARTRPDGSPVSCGFVFDLVKHRGLNPLDTDLTVVISGTAVELPSPIPHLGRGAVEVVIDQVTEEELRGTVRVPFATPADLYFDVLRDGLFACSALPLAAGTVDSSGPVLFPFSARVDGGGNAKTTALSVCMGGTQNTVGGTPREIVIPSRRNLLENASFTGWSGRLPCDWEIADDLRDAVRIDHCRIEPQSEEDHVFSSMALAFDLSGRGEAGTASGWLLRQQVDFRRIPDGVNALDLFVGIRSSAPVSLMAQLTGINEHGEPVELRTTVTAWPQWTLRTARLLLPPGARKLGNGCLSIALADRVPDWIAFGTLGLGSPGFRIEPPLTIGSPPVPTARGGEEPCNAVLNGDFSKWAHGLRFAMTKRNVETADGWFVVSKVPNADFTAEVEKLVTRDVARCIPGEEVFGICLKGAIPEGYLRLETVLDKVQLRFHWAGLLRFYARMASSGGRPGNPAKAARISRVFILERTYSTEPSREGHYSDKVAAVIARNVGILPSGEFVDCTASGDDVEKIRRLAGRSLLDPARQYALVFEFTGDANCVLADIALCPAPPEGSQRRKIGYVGLEDRNIAAQVGRLQMVEHWNDAQRLQQPAKPSEAPQGPSAACDARWAWPARKLPSVDIVICVYNAIDEVVACLDSIRRCTAIPHTVTLVDDCSDELARGVLERYVENRPWMRLILNPRNLGYTRSANLGMARSAADWVVLLNSDTVVTPGWLEGLFDCALSDPAIKLVGPLSNAATHQSVPDVQDARGKWKINSLPDGMTPADMAALVAEASPRAFPRVPLLNGFCTLIERNALKELGFLDEVSFPVGYGEENDLCVRAAKAGYQLAIADHVYVYHVKSASFGSARREDLAKQGTERCKAKHPDVDLRALQAVLSECTPLIEIRKSLRRRLSCDDGGFPAGESVQLS